MPSSMWHIGESKGNFTVAYTYVFGLGSAPMAKFFFEINAILFNHVKKPADIRTLSGNFKDLNRLAKNLPKEWNHAYRLLKKSVESGELIEELKKVWLDMVSSYGFQFNLTNMVEGSLDDSSILQSSTSKPLVAIRLANGDVCVSARGRSCSFPPHPGMIQILKLINSGRRFNVGMLKKKYSGPRNVGGEELDLPPEIIQEYLQELRAIQVVKIIS